MCKSMRTDRNARPLPSASTNTCRSGKVFQPLNGKYLEELRYHSYRRLRDIGLTTTTLD
eukprot:COSAG01_NODE_7227_length_3296_cov_1.581483_2_plen_59_part_00